MILNVILTNRRFSRNILPFDSRMLPRFCEITNACKIMSVIFDRVKVRN